MRWAVEVAAQRGTGQDRAVVYARGDELVVALADGAGGTAHGAAAAEAIVAAAATMTDPVALLTGLDTRVPGQSTAVILTVGAVGAGASVGAGGAGASVGAVVAGASVGARGAGASVGAAVAGATAGAVVAGASVGDSGAWLIGDDVVELTEAQHRKPLVGGGCAPVAFRAAFAGTLLVASDGLLRYAKPSDIARLARAFDARGLIDLVRLPSGGLQDDVSVVLVRR